VSTIWGLSHFYATLQFYAPLLEGRGKIVKYPGQIPALTADITEEGEECEKDYTVRSEI
jgi:hypothetical protein